MGNTRSSRAASSVDQKEASAANNGASAKEDEVRRCLDLVNSTETTPEAVAVIAEPILEWVGMCIDSTYSPVDEQLLFQCLEAMKTFSPLQGLIHTCLAMYQRLLTSSVFSLRYVEPICETLNLVNVDQEETSLLNVIELILQRTHETPKHSSVKSQLLHILLEMREKFSRSIILFEFIKRHFLPLDLLTYLLSCPRIRTSSVDEEKRQLCVRALLDLEQSDPEGFLNQIDLEMYKSMLLMLNREGSSNGDLSKLINRLKGKFSRFASHDEARKFYQTQLEITPLAPDEIKIIAEYCIDFYFVGQMIDANDFYKNWCAGEILCVEEKQLFVHWVGYHAMYGYDEWIPLNSGRIAPAFTHTTTTRAVVKPVRFMDGFKEGMMAEPVLNIATEELLRAARERYGNDMQNIINLCRFENRDNFKHLY
eukprot:TRINITY_DN33651_c0_g1_i6.p1 TRINITY_DN33651_c0_g1~~TRINITY_DN33651_c0_g1_i6.p1  ORF type:complete len:424 (-),score=81.52 TRINITY_DN33651_c0_g1_i6:30-1301(-)